MIGKEEHSDLTRKYYPLHVHTTTGSIGDSILRIKDYVKRGIEYGLDALAITDHGSMSAIYELIDACKEEGIKPIIGMEAYEVDDMHKLTFTKDDPDKRYHLVLLAKTTEGFHNLLSIHNAAQIEGKYRRFPRCDREVLERYGKGIIALSACVAGRIPQLILENKMDEAEEVIKDYQEIFDEFYLEIQPGTFEEQIKVNDTIVELSRKTGAPVVVTNDIHYLDAKDYEFHDYHVKLGRSSAGEKIDTDSLAYPDTCYWFMDIDSLKKAFYYTEIVTPEVVDEALANAEKIATSCHISVDTEMHMPKFSLPDGMSEREVLYTLCYQRLQEIIPEKKDPSTYVDRLKRELSVIEKKGFCGYFLIVADYIEWAKEHDIAVGPGRGSAAGSLVSYLLGISQADPIQYHLLFERFLDEHKAACPDIDTDYDPSRREEVFEYIVDHYGRNCCARVGTTGIRKAKGAIRDAARVLGIEYAEANEIAKLIPSVYYGDDGSKTVDLDIADALKVVPELRAAKKRYPKLFEVAQGIENLPRSMGLHAAGILISPVDLTDKLPLTDSGTEGVLATSLSLDDAERFLVKFDMLSLDYLSVIHHTEKDIGIIYDFNDQTLFDDPEVWKLIGSRDTTGVFQISSPIYKSRMPRLHPTSIPELAACLALVRGPCISSGADEVYMDILNGKREVEHIHPLYDDITKDTNGILLYQEQIMQLAVAFGYTLSEGYNIMKAAQKKKVDKLKEMRSDFLAHAAKKNCDEATANKIFNMVVSAGLYSFNLSHAVSYAFIVWESAWLKVHYPVEYMKNLLTNAYVGAKKDMYSSLVKDCRRMGIKFLPPDVNKSSWQFTVEDGKIRVGLCAIKGFGEKAAMQIKDKTFKDLEDLLGHVEKRSFNKKVVNIAIFSGLLDSLHPEESRYEYYLDYSKENKSEPLDKISISKDFKFEPKRCEAGKSTEKKFLGADFGLCA